MRRKFSTLAILATCVAMLPVFGATPAHAATTCDGLPATIVGTNGNDTLAGTIGPDVIAGLGGNDTIEGLSGDDRICGGDGDDIIYGEVAVFVIPAATGDNDRIFGQGDNDKLFGDWGEAEVPAGVGVAGGVDHLDGGVGSDTLYGIARDLVFTTTAEAVGFTDDTLIGGDGADTIFGQGKDLTLGLAGGTTIEGGDTIIDSGEGADTVYGDYQTYTINGILPDIITGWRDTITTGEGSDVIFGDIETITGTIIPLLTGMNDNINGGVGTDTANGGLGTDTCTNTEIEISCEL